MSYNIDVTAVSDECDRETDDDANSCCDSVDSIECDANSPWCLIPEPVFHNILFHLTTRDILNAGECCRRWYDMSQENFLWRKTFQRDFKVDRTVALKPGE